MNKVNFPRQVFENRVNWKDELIINKTLQALIVDNSTYLSEAKSGDHLNDLYALENWFYGVQNGVVVESGGFDGLEFSTSYLFSKSFGWTSVLIEADIQNYDNMRINRKDAININCALCDSPRTLHYVTGGTTGGIYEFMSSNFLFGWHKSLWNEHADDGHYLAGSTELKDLTTVECVTISTVFSLLELKRIDLWILDVEGAELAVLESVDWNKISISTIIMEADESSPEKNQKKLDVLTRNGFTCRMSISNADELCTHKSFIPSSKATFVSENRTVNGKR